MQILWVVYLLEKGRVIISDINRLFPVELQEGRSKGFDWHARVVDSISALIVTITFTRVFIIALVVKVLQSHRHNLLNNQSVCLDLRSISIMCISRVFCLILQNSYVGYPSRMSLLASWSENLAIRGTWGRAPSCCSSGTLRPLTSYNPGIVRPDKICHFTANVHNRSFLQSPRYAPIPVRFCIILRNNWWCRVEDWRLHRPLCWRKP
jgi:hypothetical protein